MSEVCVRVAVRIRPLLRRELLHHHKVCVRVVPPGSAQVMLGSDRLFSFDHAFGPTASQDEVYESCVQPLVESLLDGYNATVFSYGQTGSGKTYTLGGGSQDEGGIIERVAQHVFLLLATQKNNESVEAMVRVSYMELYREELRDLLDMNTNYKELHIRDDEKGNTVVVGAREMVVTSAEELLSVVEMGNAFRHTGATGMNEHSSRSHVILTLQVNICSQSNNNPSLKSVRSSKLCLVDLAGSERAGKTDNTGEQLKESALINTGLLALGNVIRALSDRRRCRRGNSCSGAHVPYRDAKITRLLRDSLGGNAHTVMVACVSPSHHFVAETLNVLQFASKARHIRNCPGPAPPLTDIKSDPNTWQPGEARLRELEYEVQTLRELLKEKEKDIEREKTGSSGGEKDGFKLPSQMNVSKLDKRLNQGKAGQYLFLAKEAATLLANLSEASPSDLFRQNMQDWQERLAAVSQSHQTDNIDCSEGAGDQPPHVASLKLRGDLCKCQEALKEKEHHLEQKDEELRQIQKEVEKLLEERRTLLLALEEENERSRIQTEQLVNKQILIDRLRSNLMAVPGMTPGATGEASPSGNSCTRPHSVPLIRHSSLHHTRKIHSSPPACSLERVMAAFKMHGHLLLAEIEEKDEVYSPFITQQAESEERSRNNYEEEEMEMEGSMCRKKFRHSLNRTWTSWEKKLLLKPKSTGLELDNGKTAVQESDQIADTKENLMKKVRRCSNAERRIHELTVNMLMKEDLIKELHKTERETQAVDRDDTGEGKMLERLSMQSQQIRAEVYHSLQNMRQARAKLQRSLRELDDTPDSNRKLYQDKEQTLESSAVPKSFHQEAAGSMLRDSSWLEEEEERVIQKRAQLQELEEELKRKEEVLHHREACLQQKNKLEIKMLQSSQALSRDLLHVSVQLESVEEQLQSQNSVRKTRGVTIGGLEKERDMLKMRRDTLEAQLRDNRVLSVEEEHSLLQLEEAIEALDTTLEFKNHCIQDQQKHLLVRNSPLHESKDTEPAEHADITRKLKKLSLPEAIELLIKYFNKVVCLREAEHRLHLQCEELELHAGEQEAALREMEAAMQRLTLDADRRLTQQHRDHQNIIQLLLKKLKEGVSGEAQQQIQDRIQHLEKELFFYRSSSRQLKKKLKDFLSDTDNQSPCTQESRQRQDTHIPVGRNKPKTYCEEAGKTTHISTTYTKIYTEQTDTKDLTPSSPSVIQLLPKTKTSENSKVLSQSNERSTRGQPVRSSEMTPVRLCRRELREIPAADLQLYGSATRRHQSAVNSSYESMMEDSIEVPRNT